VAGAGVSLFNLDGSKPPCVGLELAGCSSGA